MQKKLFGITSAIYFIIVVIFLTVNIINVERAKVFMESNFLSKSFAISELWTSICDNFKFYIYEELSARFFIIFCFSFYVTFRFFKRFYHLTFLSPALGGFIFLLPLSFHPYHYFMASYTNLIIFISVSLSLFLKKQVLEGIDGLKFKFTINALSVIFIIYMFILDIPLAIDKFKGLKHFTFTSSYPRQKAVLTLLSFPPFSTVYIPPNWEAKQYFGDWLKIYGIEKIIKLQPLSVQNFNEIIVGDNLVKDYLFHNKFRFWKINKSGPSVKLEFQNKGRGYKVMIKKQGEEIINFSGLIQDIPVESNATYVFGAWIKVKNFSEWTCLKIKEVGSQKEICTFGIGMLEGVSNWRLLCAFYEVSPDTREVKFIMAPVGCFKRGEVYIWKPFFYKLKPGVKFLNYNF